MNRSDLLTYLRETARREGKPDTYAIEGLLIFDKSMILFKMILDSATSIEEAREFINDLSPDNPNSGFEEVSNPVTDLIKKTVSEGWKHIKTEPDKVYFEVPSTVSHDDLLIERFQYDKLGYKLMIKRV